MGIKQFLPEEALKCALNSELQAAKYYQAIAGKVSNPKVRQKFESLVRDEKEHYRVLEESRARIIGSVSSKLPDPAGGCKVELPPDLKLNDLSSVESVIKTAIKAEEFAFQFYTKAAEASSDADTAQIFRRLASMEKGHKRELQEELDFISNDQLYWMQTATEQRSMED